MVACAGVQLEWPPVDLGGHRKVAEGPFPLGCGGQYLAHPVAFSETVGSVDRIDVDDTGATGLEEFLVADVRCSTHGWFLLLFCFQRKYAGPSHDICVRKLAFFLNFVKYQKNAGRRVIARKKWCEGGETDQ